MPRETLTTYRFGTFTLQETTRRLLRDETPVAVTPKAFDLLCCLVTRAGMVVSRDELLKLVWPDAVVEEANLSQQVFGLRKALGDCSGYIATVPGRGYSFVEPVVAETPTEIPPDAEAVVPAEAAPPPIETPPDSISPSEQPRPRLHLPWIVAAGCAAVLMSLAGWLVAKRHRQTAPAPAYVSVLLADFQNSTGNPNIDSTLRQAMEIELEQSPFLSVLGRSEVGETLQQMGRDPSEAITAAVAREVCERANHQVLITGTIARLGSEYVTTVQAAECATGRLLVGDRRTSPSENGLLQAMDASAQTLRERLGESAASIQRYTTPIERATTPSLDALKAYSLGMQMEDRGGDWAKVLEMYRRAIQLDPEFAMGYIALANGYYANDEQNEAAAAAHKAYALATGADGHRGVRGTERERLLIEYRFHADTEQDLPSAIHTAETWSAIYPRDWQPLILSAGLYNDMGQYPQAIAAGRKALALAPNHALIYSVLARSERRSGNYAEVRRLGAEAAMLGALSTGMHGTLYQTAVVQNDAALLEQETAWAKQEDAWFAMALLAENAAVEGRLAESRDRYNTTRERAARHNLTEVDDSIPVELADTLLSYGDAVGARAVLAPVQNRPLGWNDRADRAVVRALLGDRAEAEAFLLAARALPNATLLQHYNVPRVKAALALESGRANDAAAALEETRPFELTDLRAITLRASALEKAGQYPAAIEVDRRILANRGVDPVAVALPLAQLNLARCLHALHRDAESREAYRILLADWAHADANLALVQTTRREAAALSVP